MRTVVPFRGRLRFLAIGLIVTNAAAAAVVLLTSGPTSEPDCSTVVSALLLGALFGGTETACALALGSRLRALHAPWETDDPARSTGCVSTVAIGAALTCLTVPIGWAIFFWVQGRVDPADAPLAIVLGMALGLQAWIAPWLLVLEVAHGGIGPSACDEPARAAGRHHG